MTERDRSALRWLLGLLLPLLVATLGGWAHSVNAQLAQHATSITREAQRGDDTHDRLERIENKLDNVLTKVRK